MDRRAGGPGAEVAGVARVALFLAVSDTSSPEDRGVSFVPTARFLAVQRKHGPESLGSFSSPMDCNRDWPALLNFNGGSKGSASASLKLLCRWRLSDEKEMLGIESFRSLSLSWLGMLTERIGGPVGLGNWSVDVRLGVSPPRDLEDEWSGKLNEGVLAAANKGAPPVSRLDGGTCSLAW